MERLLDIGEVSKILGVTKATIYSWTSQNKIPHIKLSKRLLKFKEQEIIDWIAEKSVLVGPACSTGKRRRNTRTKTPLCLGSDYIERILRNAKEEVLHGG